MVSITLKGLWMVSDRIVNFQFFVKFHRSGPAIIFIFFEQSRSMLVLHQKSSLSSQELSGPDQDGEYYSGRSMDGF